MRPILVTQRVSREGPAGERRDALAQDWPPFLAACGLLPVPVPNHAGCARQLAKTLPWQGLLLTGGDHLSSHGGEAPERDQVERWLLGEALRLGRPVLGVCRGMQLLLDHCGGELVPIAGHAGARHSLELAGGERQVNSFHTLGCRSVPPEIEPWAWAQDGSIEALRHRRLPMLAVMWHPERQQPWDPLDIELFTNHFGPSVAQGHG